MGTAQQHAKVNPSAKLPLTMPAMENQVGFTTDQYPGTPNATLGYLTSNYSEQLCRFAVWNQCNQCVITCCDHVYVSGGFRIFNLHTLALDVGEIQDSWINIQ